MSQLINQLNEEANAEIEARKAELDQQKALLVTERAHEALNRKEQELYAARERVSTLETELEDDRQAVAELSHVQTPIEG